MAEQEHGLDAKGVRRQQLGDPLGLVVGAGEQDGDRPEVGFGDSVRLELFAERPEEVGGEQVGGAVGDEHQADDPTLIAGEQAGDEIGQGVAQVVAVLEQSRPFSEEIVEAWQLAILVRGGEQEAI